MSGGDDDGKTEDPTSKKVEDAREKGNVPNSREAANFATFAAAALMIGALAPSAATELVQILRPFLAIPDLMARDPRALGQVLSTALIEVGLAIFLCLFVFLVAGLAATWGQIGFLFTPSLLSFDLNRLNPAKGFAKLFAVQNVIELLKSVVKLIVVGSIMTMLLMPMLTNFERYFQLEPVQLPGEFRSSTLRLLTGALSITFIVAGLDVFWTRFQWWKKLKMSKQEVKDEHKQSEGSPEVKQRLRQIRFDKARRRIMQVVPKADVVITNPTHYAVVMQYDPDTMGAPRLVAKGVDFLAAKIREVAQEHNIPIVENPPLARAIYATVDIDQEIKPDQYRAVAEIISYVFKLKKKVIKM